MNTDARRKASAAFHAKREAAGYRKVTLWLSQAARDVLAEQGAVLGSKDVVADVAIRSLGITNPAPKLADTSRAKVTDPGMDKPLKSHFRPNPKPGKR